MIIIDCKITIFPYTCLLVVIHSYNTIMHDIWFKTKIGKRTPQWLIIGKLISQYTSYAAMFCLLHSGICKEQHEKHLCNSSSHYGNSLEKCVPCISINESHNASISAMSNFFHCIIAVRSVSAIFYTSLRSHYALTTNHHLTRL